MRSPRSSSDASTLLVLIKGLQFFSSLSDVAWNRFQPLLYMSQGYSTQQIGTLKTISFATKFLGGPLWSLASDMKSPVVVLMFSYFLGLLTLVSVRYLLLIQAPFWMFIIARVLRSATNAVGPLRDAITLEHTKKRKDEESYGRQRLFASLAWGMGSYLGGYLIDIFGLWCVFPYTFGMTILTVALLAVIWKLSSGDVETEKRESKKKASPREILSSLKSLINYRPVRLYIFCVAVLGFAMVLVDTVLQIQIEKLGGSRSFSGLTTLSSILGGIPIFWYSKRIFVHQGGWKMLWYAMAIVMFRLPLLAYFVVTEDDLSYILPIQLFHGVAFALIWSGGTDYLQHHAPPMVTASTQTILSTTYFTIGQGVGNIFWMSLYDNMGPKKMYMLGTAIVTAAYAASLFAMKNNNRNRKLDDRDHDLLLPMANGSSNSSTYIEGGIGLTSSSSSSRNSNAVESRSYRRTDVTVV